MPAKSGFVSIRGDKETEQKLTTKYIVARPMRRFFSKWSLAGVREAKKNAPRFQGHYRRSLTSDIDPSEMPLWARFGSNVGLQYDGKIGIIAAAIEGGTGTQADLPGGTGRRHVPPLKPLEEWAAKKQIPDKSSPGRVLTGRDVQWIIARRGGLKPRRVLRNAAKEIEPRISGWIVTMGRDMAADATRRANRV